MARRKLAREASRSDLNLSRLVGHANLLDSLMLELGRAEREQQQKQQPVNVTVQRTVKPDSSRHIQWADCVVVEPEEDWNLSDAESDSENEEECDSEECLDMEANMVSLQRVPSRRNLSSFNTQNIITYSTLMSYPDTDEDDDEDFDVLQLEYSPSHSSPPELDNDSDSSEDEAMPPSPPTSHLPSFLSTNPSTQNLSKPLIPENLSSEPLIFEKAYYAPPNTHSDLTPTISVF
ncbi:hypothetical protein EPUL_006624 [Erysiphe pulchra]|uniref:Uncharacterized protein n=1 Tax=Erysiphe pulchra TaxID=225359 RepID=A0A2S4PUY3_9PEZI|nr:hypothetical protein EPUL_006624 [Erysiphe pulchra]